jgi:type IV pilus assembly protein PilN
MIHINLIGAQETAQSFEQRRQLRLAYGVLAANLAVILLTSFVLNRLCASRQGDLAETKTALQEVLKVVRDVEGEEKKRGILEEKRLVIADLERKEIGPLRILEALSDATPTRLWLTEFLDKGGEVTITGLAIDDPTVADFLERLQRSPHFHGLELVVTAQAAEGATRVKKFVMKGPLTYSARNGNGTAGNGKPDRGTP